MALVVEEIPVPVISFKSHIRCGCYVWQRLYLAQIALRGRFDRRDLCEEVDMDNTVLNHFLGHTFVCVYSHVDDRSFEGGQVLREELLLQLDEISSWSLVVGFD